MPASREQPMDAFPCPIPHPPPLGFRQRVWRGRRTSLPGECISAPAYGFWGRGQGGEATASESWSWLEECVWERVCGPISSAPVVSLHARAHVDFQVGLRSKHGKTVCDEPVYGRGCAGRGRSPPVSVTPKCNQVGRLPQSRRGWN